MPDHDAGIDAREPRDERQQLVPERERVARMKAAVLELVDRPQMQRRQVDELAHTSFVEETVTGDGTFDVPEKPPEDEPDEPDPRARLGARGAPAPMPHDERGEQDEPQDGDGEVDRAVEREYRSPRDEDRRHRPGEHRGGAPLAERARDRPPRREDAESPERETEVDDHCSIRVVALPERRKRTPSRYSGRRRTAARNRSETSSRRRSRSASFGPRCLAK